MNSTPELDLDSTAENMDSTTARLDSTTVLVLAGPTENFPVRF